MEIEFTGSKVTVNSDGSTVTEESNTVTLDNSLSLAPLKALLLGAFNSDPTGLTFADKGTVWYNTHSNEIKYWDGSYVIALGAAGAGFTNLNGQTGGTQLFGTVGTVGTAPAWVSASNTHTLNIPMASTAGVTAGLLSKTEYDALGASDFISELTGDVTTSGYGSTVATLKSVVVAATAPKVTYDAKGRVTGGASLASTDIPNLDAGKITSGILGVVNGGTGAATLPLNAVVVGNGTAAPLSVAPGGAGNVLTSTGVVWESAPSSGGGGGGGGAVQTVTQVGHGFLIGDAVYLNGGIYVKAKADAANTAETVGVVSSVTSLDVFQVTEVGYIKYLSGLTAGTVYFLSDTVAGLLTATEPMTIGAVTKPMLIADSTTSGYVLNYRGAIVGGANARTHTFLSNNATSSVQSVGNYDAGDLTGWVYINASPTSYRFYVNTKWVKTGAGTDFNINTQTTGDTPPLGFSLTITTSGLIQCTLPTITGFSYAEINYAINAPALGSSSVGQVPLGGLVAVMPNIDAVNAWQPPATGIIKDSFMRADGTIINAGHIAQGCLLALNTVLPSLTAKYLKGGATSGTTGGSNSFTPAGTNATSNVPASGLTFSGSGVNPSSTFSAAGNFTDSVSVPAHYHGIGTGTGLSAAGQTLGSISIPVARSLGSGLTSGQTGTTSGSMSAPTTHSHTIDGGIITTSGSAWTGYYVVQTPAGVKVVSATEAGTTGTSAPNIDHTHTISHTHSVTGSTDIWHEHSSSTVTGTIGLGTGSNGNIPMTGTGTATARSTWFTSTTYTPSGTVAGTATAAAQIFTGTAASSEPAYVETVWVIRVK
jgi:hypothetical protein